MAQIQLKKIRYNHDAIIDWLIANPDKTQGECAREFGMTQTWLSVVINSDAFRERFAEKSNAVFRETIVPLREKILGVSHVAFEKLGQAVEASQDPEFILAVADKTAKALGVGQQKAASLGTVVQNNYYSVDREVLAQARERMHKKATIEGEFCDEGDALSSSTDVQSRGGS